MNFRGSARYIPRYDEHPPPADEDDAVGDLDFDIVFAHGHSHQQQQQDPHDGQRPWQQRQQRHEDQPHALPPAPAADPAMRGLDPQELRQFGIRVPGEDDADIDANAFDDTDEEEEEQLIFDFDLEDEETGHHLYGGHHHRRFSPALPLPRGDSPVEEADPDENAAQHRQEHIGDLAAQVVRQQRYVDNVRQQLHFGPHAPADGGIEGWRRELRRAQDELRMLRETLRVVVNAQGGDGLGREGQNGGAVMGWDGDVDGENNSDHDNDSGDGEARPQRRQGRDGEQRQPGLDPARRRKIEQDLAELREIDLQLRWGGAAPEELQQVAGEMQHLQGILDGRYAAWGRGRSASPSSSPKSASSSISSTSSSDHRRPKRKPQPPPGCHHPVPPLSKEDPRLPPPHIPHASPTALHDSEGPRYLALVTLDNPHPAARQAEQDILAKAEQAFARYEAPWFTVIDRAMGGGALRELSSGPRGVIWVVEQGRVDVVGAMVKAREEPFGVESWNVLGVGVGGAEGWVFCLHKEKKRKGKAAGGGGGGGGGGEGDAG